MGAVQPQEAPIVTPRTGNPRGRPPGAKNLPKLEAFIEERLANPAPIPPRPAKKAYNPWANLTPEERTAKARAMQAKRRPETYCLGGSKPGVPSCLTVAQHKQMQDEFKPLIAKVLKKMATKGELTDDPMAVTALKETLKILTTDSTTRDKLAAARLLLDFTKSKPTTKVEHTVKTAEELLDELGED